MYQMSIFFSSIFHKITRFLWNFTWPHMICLSNSSYYSFTTQSFFLYVIQDICTCTSGTHIIFITFSFLWGKHMYFCEGNICIFVTTFVFIKKSLFRVFVLKPSMSKCCAKACFSLVLNCLFRWRCITLDIIFLSHCTIIQRKIHYNLLFLLITVAQC